MMKKKKVQNCPAIEAEDTTSNLPSEVIYIILSKLAVKSLLPCRCVCKPWLALISDPQFIASHLAEAIRSQRYRLIFSVYKSPCFYSIDCESLGMSRELDFPIKKYLKASALCSCNGMLLLNVARDVMYVLWNPSTRSYIKFAFPYRQLCGVNVYGICYDSSTGDYELVFISDSYPSGLMVFTCKTNSWTVATELPYSMKFWERSGISVSGAPHWVVALKKDHKLEFVQPTNASSATPHSYDDVEEAVPCYLKCIGRREAHRIVCFDSAEKKFKEVPPPKWMCEEDIFYLRVMRECLSLYIRPSCFQQFDVWVMKEYGVRNSWTKLISIPYKVGTRTLCYPHPICLTEKGEVVLRDGETLVLYDPVEQKVISMKLSDDYSYGSWVVSCVDSLVLPTRDKLIKRQQQKHKENGKGALLG